MFNGNYFFLAEKTFLRKINANRKHFFKKEIRSENPLLWRIHFSTISEAGDVTISQLGSVGKTFLYFWKNIFDLHWFSEQMIFSQENKRQKTKNSFPLKINANDIF